MNNPLTTIKPKGDGTTARLLMNRIRLHKQEKLASYDPDLEECKEICYAVFRKKLYESMSKGMQLIYRDFNALMIAATPKAEVVFEQVKKLSINLSDIEREFEPDMWSHISTKVKTRFSKALRADQDERKEELRYVKAVFNAQQKISIEIDDDMYEAFEEQGDTVAAFSLDRLDTHILPDVNRNPANLMTPSEIVRYIIPKSKGTIAHLYPTNIGKELDRLGYEKERGRYFVQLVAR